MKVEIAVGLRLTTNAIEQFTFQVPRTRLNYFQDDVYPSTLCVEESPLTAKQWLQGENGLQRTCSLQPPNMKSCMLIPMAGILIIIITLLFSKCCSKRTSSCQKIYKLQPWIQKRPPKKGRGKGIKCTLYRWLIWTWQLMSAMIDKMGDKDDDPLPQQNMDGADSDEWSD